MRSSTSNSEYPRAPFTSAILWLLGLIVLICLCAEIGTRYGFSRVSRIQNRVDQEKTAFLTLHPGSSGAPRNIAIVGNSLLLFSVDIPLLNSLGSGKFHYSRFVLEQTQYVDWFFGLQRLFNEGARPDGIVLVLGANHWLADAVRGEYFAYELMRPLDIGNVARELNLDRTTASNYFFASLSAWLGGRAEIRKFLLSNIIPDLEQFVRVLNGGPPSYPGDDLIFEHTQERMERIKSLCERYGVQLVSVLHPTLQSQAPFAALSRAANVSGLPLVIPVAKMEYPNSFYFDGYHLNTQGMDRFTRDLLHPLEAALLANNAKLPSPS